MRIRKRLKNSNVFPALGRLFIGPDFSGRPIDLHYFDNPYVLPLLIGAALVIGILAGIYPAFFLSSFKPVSVLKGSVGTGKRARFFSLRNVLVVFQFVFSVSLMFCIVIIYGQLNYLRNSKLGFSGKNVVVLQNFGLADTQNDRLKTELLINPSVTHVGGSSVLPGQIVDDKFIFNIEGVNNSQDAPSLYLMKCDYGFLEAMEMEMGEGRFFSREHQTDASAAIVNEEVIQKSGLSDPVGKNIMIGGFHLHIIGVIRNFHYKSLHEEMPMLALKLFSGVSHDRNRSLAFYPVRDCGSADYRIDRKLSSDQSRRYKSPSFPPE